MIDDVFDGKITIDGSSIYGMSDVNNSDLLLVPDLETFRRLPIDDNDFGNVGMFMCFVHDPSGKPAKGCTRSILKSELNGMIKLGFDKMNVGFEPEFFLLKAKPSAPNDTTVQLDYGSYADIEAGSDFGGRIRREICFEFERVGIIPLSIHHERSPSQHEITFKFDNALRSCDNFILYKIIAKAVAKNHGLYLDFDPKVFDGANGNGCHVNVSLSKDDKNVFACNDGLSDVARHFLSGLIDNAKAITYFANSKESSYKRLVPNCEAPTKICWGYHNRSAFIRVPKASGNATRIELRSPDMEMNPYLAVTGILRAGLDGIKRKSEPPDPVDLNAWKHVKAYGLPSSLEIARREFEGTKLLSSITGGVND